MGAIIQKHNNKIINACTAPEPKPRNCNCRNKDKCPMNGNCLTETVIYRAEVDTPLGPREYIGSTEKDFKIRYNGHTQSFRSSTKQNATALSKCLWDHNLQPNPEIKWTILSNAHAYAPGHPFCDLCTTEKLCILKNIHNEHSLNKRNEICKMCPHRDKFSLGTFRM